MFHHDRAGLHRRGFYGDGNVVRAAGFQRSFVDEVDRVDRCLDRSGMRIEHYRVSCSQHSDGIAENRLTRVGAGCDRTDHAEGSHLDQGESPVSGPCGGRDILGTRSLVCYQVMFEDLISDIAHTGLIHAHSGEHFRALVDLAADTGDDLFSLIHGHVAHNDLCLLGCGYRIVHFLEDTVLACRSIRDLHFCHDFLYNFLYQIFIDRH